MKEGIKIKPLRLKKDIILKIEEMAARENRTFNNMVETILLESIEDQVLQERRLEADNTFVCERLGTGMGKCLKMCPA